MSECHNIRGAWQHSDVCIGWFPFVAITNCNVVTNPHDPTTVLKELRPGSGVGWQSARNPTASPTPPMRRPRDGYAWVYTRAGTITGWVKADALAADPGAASKPPLLGPGGYDFEVGRARDDGWVGPLPKKPSGCGKVSLSKPLMRVSVRDTYLRYSPRGTSYHYLHRGDLVRLLIVNGPHGFAFGEVVDADGLAFPGVRGWLLHESLTRVE